MFTPGISKLYQLFTCGYLFTSDNSSSCFPSDADQHASDGFLADLDINSVQIPQTANPLTAEQHRQLVSVITSQQYDDQCSDYGIELYKTVKFFVCGQ